MRRGPRLLRRRHLLRHPVRRGRGRGTERRRLAAVGHLAGPTLSSDGGAKSTTSHRGRRVGRSFAEDDLDRVRGYHATEPYTKAMPKRKVWVEAFFAEAKDWHGLRHSPAARADQGKRRGAADRGRAERRAGATNDLGHCQKYQPSSTARVVLPGAKPIIYPLG